MVGLGTYIIIVVANRSDPDPTGKRPISVYMFAAAFVTLWLAYIGAIIIVHSLVALIGTNVTYASTAIHPFGDQAVRGVSIGLLLLVIGGALHVTHRRRGLELADGDVDPASPTKRVARSYVSAVSFIAIILFLVMVVASLYTLLGIIAPGVYAAAGRLTSFKSLLDELFVVIMSIVIFTNHQILAPTSLRLWGGAPTSSTVVDVVVVETSTVEPGDSEA